MTISGWCLLLFGTLLLFFGLMFDVTIHSDYSYNALAGYVPSSDVINIGKLQQQMMLFESGLASILGGVVLIAAGGIANRLKPVSSGTEEIQTPIEPNAVEVGIE